MKSKRIISAFLLIAIIFCFFGCERSFEADRVKCILAESAQEIEFDHLEFDEENLTVTAVTSEDEKIVFRCERGREYKGIVQNPDWLRLYKMELTIKNRSKYDIRNLQPYLKRQWDMLTSESFSPDISEIKHKSTVKTSVYALTDFGIEVMRSAFPDNSFMIKYDAYKKEVSSGSFETECSYE